MDSTIIGNGGKFQAGTIPPEFIALDDDLRFIKVRKNSKIPLEADWPGINNYFVHDPNLQSWISQGGNWGYFLRDDTDLCILDADRPDELQDLVSFLGPTLTVKTGRDGTGYHILFRCEGLHTRKLFLYSPDKKGNDGNPLSLGDIRPGATEKKYQCIGPGSIHPDTGRPYTIIDSSSPVIIKKENLFKVIGKYRAKNQTGKSLRRKVATGERDDYLIRQAGILFNRGYRASDLLRELSKINQEDCNPPIEVQELERIWKSATTNFIPAPPTRTLAIDERPYQAFTLTDLGNAERFKAVYGNQVLFCPTLKKWYIWNGAYWKPDDTGERDRLAINIVRSIYGEAEREEDDKKRQCIASWGTSSESHQKRTAMLQTASSLLSIHHNELDNQPDLFNLQNGTYNLVTHEFREHSPEDKITKISKTEYQMGATCPTWEAHLQLVFENDTELINGFQELAGYSLQSGNVAEIFCIAWGTGRNGKGKTFDALTYIFGDYAGNTPFSTFVSSKYGVGRGSATPELFDLIGVRFVRASESEEGARLAESLIKTLTGGDLVTARGLYQGFITYKPEYTIFLQTNHKPIIRFWDQAIEARIWLIPFNTFIEPDKRDYKILDKLIDEAPGIFNWMINGLKRYQARGQLEQPAAVRAATDEYKFEQDRIGEFIASCCVKEPGTWIFKKMLYTAYADDCENNGIEPESQNSFTRLLQQNHGIRDGPRRKGGRTWDGIRLMRLDEKPDYTPLQKGDTFDTKPEKSQCNEQLENYTKNVSPSDTTQEEPVLRVDTNQNDCISGDTMTHCDTFFDKSLYEVNIEKLQKKSDNSVTLSPTPDPSFEALEEWIKKWQVPKIPPPDQYRDYVTGAPGRCVCVGCNNTPLKTASGNFPLCQQHLREYTTLYEREYQEAKP